MRLLFAKHTLAWPRASGHDLRTYYLARACAALGHEVGLATVAEPSPQALAGLPLAGRFRIAMQDDGGKTADGTGMQRRFRSFWGVPDAALLSLRDAVRAFSPEAVIVAGLDALPFFPALSGVTRIWYAADEWVLHHLSLARAQWRTAREHLKAAAVKGLYERAHRGAVDRVWVVSETDARAMRWIAGMHHVDVLPNGVDGEFFAPGQEAVKDESAVFWGRLDFEPNIQAIEWFCKVVWPIVRQKAPAASFTAIGFNPTAEVLHLASVPGVSILSDLPDLRSTARSHAAAVLPLVSGAGIKNKLLEAAALQLPIVCTPRAGLGLRGHPPLLMPATPQAFADTLITLWADPRRREEVARATREWVTANHSWEATARGAVALIEASRHGS